MQHYYQKYYNELYKNRAKEFFAQPLPYKNKNGEIVKPKGKTYIKDDRIVSCYEEADGSLTLRQVAPYSYNVEIPNFTKNLVINSSYYDEYTHNYLGDYLRFMRDYHGIDLMSMYIDVQKEKGKSCSVDEIKSKISRIKQEEGIAESKYSVRNSIWGAKNQIN